MMQSLQLFALGVYGLGAAFSQSLMSAGAFLLLLLLAVSFLGGLWKKLSPVERKLVVLAFVFVVFSSSNLLWREWDEHSLKALRYIPNFLVPLSILSLPKPDARKKKLFLSLMSLCYWIVTARCLYDVAILQIPASGYLKNPIYFAYSLLPAFIFFLRLFTLERSLQNGLTLFSILLSILLSGNRMIFIVAMLVLLWNAWRTSVPHLKKMSLALCGLAAISGGLLYQYDEEFRTKLARSSNLRTDPSVTWRTRAWKHNWELFLQSPLLGVGFERNAIDTSVNTELAGHWDPGFRIYAHSVYFQALADSGVVGFFLLFGFFFYLAYLFPSLRMLFIFSALAGLTENTFNNSRPTHALFFFILMFGLYWEPQRD